MRLLGGADAPAPVDEAVAPVVRGGPVRAYVELRTSVGARVTLFATTSSRGANCLGVTWSGTSRPRAGATCARDERALPLHVIESGTRVRGSWVALLFGKAAPEIERLELVSTTGAVVAVPTSASHFLVEVPRWAGDAELIAYGAGGLILARHELETPPSWTPPDPPGETTPVLVREFANRTWTIENYAATGARRCYGVSATYGSGDAAPSGTAGGSAFRCVAESSVSNGQLSVLGPDDWPSVGGSDTWTTVVGAVGSDVARVDVTLADRMRREAVLRQATFVYFGRGGATGKRPVRVEAFDGAGRLVAAEPLR